MLSDNMRGNSLLKTAHGDNMITKLVVTGLSGVQFITQGVIRRVVLNWQST